MIRPAGDSDFDSTDEDELFDMYDPSCKDTGASNSIQKRKSRPSVISTQHTSCTAPNSLSLSGGIPVLQCNPVVLHDMQTAISSGNVVAVEQVLKKVDSPNMLLKSGWPLIVHAAYFCHYSVVELLINHGADISAVNDTGDTALHASCKSGTNPKSEAIMKTVYALVSSGANIDAKDFNGRTPLMYACRRNLTEVVRYLIGSSTAQQRILTRDDREWNSIDWSAIFGNVDTLKILIDALQMKIVPNNFLSSKMWPSHIAEFLETSNQPDKAEQTKIANNDDQEMKEIDDDANKGEASSQCATKQVAEPIVSMDTEDSVQQQSPSSATNPQIGDSLDITDREEMNSNKANSLLCQQGDTSTTYSSSKFQFTGIEDGDEECVLPTIIKKDTRGTTEFQTYGHLELFLAGLELSHLIPLFQKQDVKFEELLSFSMDELEKIGIKAYGTRKRILAAIQECHEKHTSTSLLPDYTKSPLTTGKLFEMMNGSSEQIEYIASCMRYIRYHVGMYPDTLYPDADKTYEKAPLQEYHEKIDGVTRSLVNLAKSLDDLKGQADDFERDTCSELTQPVGLATLENLKDSGQRARIKRLFAISIAVIAFYMWRKASLYSGV